MNRRAFIGTVAGCLFAGPLAAVEQQTAAPTPAPAPVPTPVHDQQVIPADLPKRGFFNDIQMKNTPAQAMTDSGVAAMYAPYGGYANDPWDLWGGGAWFALQSKAAFSNSGHHPGGGNFQPTMIADLISRKWECMNIPAAANADLGTDANGMFADKTFPANHSYLATETQTIAEGGKPSLIYLNSAGGTIPSNLIRKDITKVRDGYDLLTTHNPLGNGAYAMLIKWEAHGYFVINKSNGGAMAFVGFDGNPLPMPFPSPLNGSGGEAVLIDHDRQLFIAIGGLNYSSPNPNPADDYGIKIVDLKTFVTTIPPFNGPKNHDSDQSGWTWAPKRNAAYCMSGANQYAKSPQVKKLVLSEADPRNGLATFSDVPLAHTPSDTTGATTLVIAQNGCWKKLLWDDELNVLMYFASSSAPPQFINPN